MSTDCRDWISTLWRSSFKGVPFFVERESEEGGRGLVVHKFPNRDTPYIEDLGEDPREYDVTAYVHGDDSDSQAQRLMAVCTSRGAGVLVLPLLGATRVVCKTQKRAWEKDKLGYVAFELKFYREGAGFALASVPLLASTAFAAAGAAASALVGTFAGALRLAEQADFAIEAATSTIEDGLAAVDLLRTTSAIAPDVSAAVRDAVAEQLGALPTMLSPAGASAAAIEDLAARVPGLAELAVAAADGARSSSSASSSATLADATGPAAIAAGLVAAVRALADGMAPDVAVRAMLDLAGAFPVVVRAPAYPTRSAQVSAENAAAAARLVRLAGLVAWCEAVVRRPYASRPEGVSARAEIAERFERELNDAGGAENVALFVAISDLRGAAVEYLSRVVNDLAPVITIEAARSLPSLWWAWRLYADPARAGELVGRNGVAHPSYMPATFQALAR